MNLNRFGTNDGLLWHLDLKPHASGDFSIAVVQANSNLEDQVQVLTSPSATYIGVYDGHGGPEASRFVKNRLFPHLRKFASEQGGLSSDVIKKAFNATEEEFIQLVKHSWMSKPKIASVGSCCLLGAITEDTMYVANLGDSRAVLGRKGLDGRAVAERLTSDHNVAVEEIRKEVAENHPDDSHIVVYNRGVWRIKGIIQVSRSIGDIYLKNPEFSRVASVPLKRAVLTAEPSVKMRTLKPNDMFLIFASDGLWEQLSDDAAVEIVFKNPRTGIAKKLVRAAQNVAAKKREMSYDEMIKINKGVRRHYHDDITAVVIYLDQFQQGKPSGTESDSAVDIFSNPDKNSELSFDEVL